MIVDWKMMGKSYYCQEPHNERCLFFTIASEILFHLSQASF
jgi:hypothetical protein